MELYQFLKKDIMGLFGSKGKPMPKVADIFSAKDLQTIKEIIGPKRDSGSYGRYNTMANSIMQVAETPEKSFSEYEWGGIIYSVGVMSQLEPGMATMLDAAFNRFYSFTERIVFEAKHLLTPQR